MEWADGPNGHRDLTHGDYRAKVCPNGDQFNVTAWYRDDDFYHDWAFYQVNAERHAEEEIRRHEGLFR